ncbi:MAG: hypothetical protein K2X93_10665 [Candidatus Obscuribacterales bacterium]|nr:hypothetical protein [Candidatus Obscuribacterales bacterium]
MDNVLAKTRQAVSRYKSREKSDSLNATKSVWAAVRFLRKQVLELEREQPGVTVRTAHELSDVLAKLPMFRHLRNEKEAIESIQDKDQAGEHILKLEGQLKNMVKELENSKIDEIKGWVEGHPVLGALTKTLTRKMPESTYVFLFRPTKNENVELVTSRAPDGRVFTRFRPREFFDVKKLYRLYHHRPPVGAAVVVDNKLQDVIGNVPQAPEGENQLHIISAMSKDAANQPAKVFLASNPVLQSLYGMAKERKVDKGAYILLFVDAHEDVDFTDELNDELSASEDEGHDADHTDADASDFGDEGGDDSESAESDASNLENIRESAPASEPEAESSAGPEPASSSESVSYDAEHSTSGEVEATGEVEQSSGEEISTETAQPASEPVDDASHAPAPEGSAEESSQEVQSHSGEGQDGAPDPSQEETGELDRSLAQAAISGESDSTDETQSGENASDVSAHYSASYDDQQIASPEEAIDTAGSQTKVSTESNESSGTAGDAQTTLTLPSASGSANGEQTHTPVEILTRASSDGGVLTRYYANEFSDVRKIFESFGTKRTICGAAVIRGRELLQVVGNVPQSVKGKSQLDVLILESNHAADKPTRDFMADNEVLENLHQLALKGEYSEPHSKVILFADEGGRLTALSVSQKDEKGRERVSQTCAVSNFKFPREIRNSFRHQPRVVGASIIGEFKSTHNPKAHGARDGQPGGDDKRSGGRGGRNDRDRGRGAPRPPSKSVVLAAFGRTPLKQNILITEETARRLGLDFIRD